MKGNCNGSKIGDGRQQGEGIIVKQQHVTMGMEVLDCPVCSTPLSPPIFQCSLGHFICSPCRDDLPGRACAVCSRPVSGRCHGMEGVVASVVVPCSYAAHGCTNVTAYHEKAEHEEACPHAPCFCPEKGCGFEGSTTALLNHFTTQHKWPKTVFKYFEPFDVPVKAGVHVLHGCSEDGDKNNDSDLFLLHMGSLDSSLHRVSLVRVQAHAPEYMIGCSLGFSWFRGHYQVATLDMIQSSSLSKRLPKGCAFCIVPEVQRRGGGRVVLSVTIGTETEKDEDDNEEGDDNDGHSEVDDDKDDEADGHNGD